VAPSPRYQVVRHGNAEIENVGGVPVWRDRPGQRAWRTQCLGERPESPRIAVFGSSIFNGSGVPPEKVFSTLLQDMIDADVGDKTSCILNFAQAGFSLGQKLALAERHIPEHKPRWVLWEVWANDAFPYRFLGDSAFALRDAAVDELGYPAAGIGIPWLHRWLFRNSRAYEHLTLSQVPERPSGLSWPDLMRVRVLPGMDRLVELCKTHGCDVLVLPAPSLGRPFAEQHADESYLVIRDWAAERKVHYQLISELLADQDHQAIRLDPCCHYNEAGHRVLAERIAKRLSPLLRSRP
jgi:hypothetical protein